MPSLFKRSLLPKLRSFPLTAEAVTILPGAAEFRRCLLEKIAEATRRIYIVALYLQQDEAGQEILDALHAAKLKRPELEIAVVVTGPSLEPRVEGPVLVIHQSDEQLGKMDAWNRGTHGRSGLTDKVKASQVTEAQAEEEILAFLSKYVPKGVAPMCGNSIGQDRRFLVRYMPKLERFFHYRNVDVSTLKELAKRWKPEAYSSFKKAQKHTALADVHESIEELAHYRTHLLSV